MLLMVKVEALMSPGNVRHLWREHAVLHEPVSHVIILPAPPPKVDAIPIDSLKLLSGEYADTTEELLSWPTLNSHNNFVVSPGERRQHGHLFCSCCLQATGNLEHV